jgi:hypothetical protein
VKAGILFRFFCLVTRKQGKNKSGVEFFHLDNFGEGIGIYITIVECRRKFLVAKAREVWEKAKAITLNERLFRAGC